METIPEDPTIDLEVEVLIRNIKGVANEVIALIPEIPVSSAEILDRVREPWRMVNLIVTNLNIAIQEKIKILETYSIKARLKKTLTLLHHQREMLRISNKINSEIKGEMNKTQREYYLRQQRKAIKKELGELDEDIDGLDGLKEKLESMNLPLVVQKLVRKEFTRLKTI